MSLSVSVCVSVCLQSGVGAYVCQVCSIVWQGQWSRIRSAYSIPMSASVELMSDPR